VRGAARCCRGRGRYTPPIKPHFSPLSYKMTCTNCCRKTTSPLTHSLTHSYCPHSDDASKARTSQTQSRPFTHHSLTRSLHHSITPSLAHSLIHSLMYGSIPSSEDSSDARGFPHSLAHSLTPTTVSALPHSLTPPLDAPERRSSSTAAVSE
jgi:hypothetical protein